MRVLIIGGTSGLGMALKPMLSQFSEVITAGRRECDVYLDLDKPVINLDLPYNIDTMIHTVAHFGGDSDDEILACESINVIGTLKLCQLASKIGIKHFILISSIYSAFNQKDKYFSIYSLSKKHSEEIALFYCNTHALPLTILRPAPIYGFNKNLKQHQPFLAMVIAKARKGDDIEYYGVHNAKKNYIFIDDISEIIKRVVQFKIEGIYNCSHTKNVTCLEIAQAAIAAFNSNSKVYFLKNKPDILDNIFAIDDNLYKKIGYYPSISIEEGIRRIANNNIEI